MAKGSAVVGRVSIKVMPDTSDFSEDLRSDLTRIERRQGPLEIQAEVDTTGVGPEVERAVKKESGKEIELGTRLDHRSLDRDIEKLEALIRAKMDPALEAKFKVSTEDSLDRLEDVRLLMEDLRRKANVELKVDNNLAGLREAQREVEHLLGEVRDKLVFPVEMDEESLLHLKHKLNDLIDDYDGQDITLDPAIDGAASRFAATRLATLARDRMVILYPMVDSKAFRAAQTALASLSGGRMLTNMLDRLWSSLKNLDKNIPLIGSIATAIMGLAASGIAATSNLLGISRELALIGAAALALPGILGGLIVGVGSTVAVMKDFNKVLPGVGASLRALQDSMSSEFWLRAAGPIRTLLNEVLPEFAAGAQHTAAALGTYFGSMANSLTKHLGGALDPMFRNLNASILLSSTYTDAWANVIETLGTHGSNYLPRLALWFGDIGQSFSDWLDKMERSGQLQAWIDRGIDNLNALGRVIKETGRIFYGLSKAAADAGAATLDGMGDALKRIADAINRADFQRKLADVFNAAHGAMQAISTKAGPALEKFFATFSETFSDALRIVGPAIGDLLAGIATALSTSGFNEGFLNLINGIRAAITTLAPAFEPLGNILGDLGTLMGTMAEAFGPLIAKGVELFAQALDKVLPSIEAVVQSLSGTLLDVLTFIGPAFVAVADAVAALLAPLLQSPALVMAVVTAMLALKAVTAAGAIASGIATLGTTLAAFAQKMPKTAGALTKVGKAAGIAAIALTGLTLLGDAIKSSSDQMVPSTDRFSTTLNLMAEDADRAAAAVRASVPPLTDLYTAFSYQAPNGWLNSLGVTAIDANNLGDALSNLKFGTEGFQGFMIGLADTFGAIENPANLSREAITNFDMALAQAVEAGNLDTAKTAVQQFTAAAKEQGFTTAEITALMPQYNDAMATYVAAQDVANGAADRAADAMSAYEAAVVAAGGATPNMVATIQDGSKAFIDFDAAMDEAYSGLTDYMTKLQEQITAQSQWADNMARLAKRGVSEGMLAELSRMGPEGGRLVADLTTASDEQLAKMEEAFRLKSEGAVGGVDTEFGKLKNLVETQVQPAMDAAAAAVSEAQDAMKVAGANAGLGAAQGIASRRQDVEAAARRLGEAATAAYNKSLDIHSPSRVMRRSGQFTGQGVALGLLDEVESVRESAREVADAARDELEQDVQMGVGLNAKAARGAVSDAGASGGSTTNKTLNYYAAAGSSLGSEEDLFAAANRGRMVF